MVSGFNGSWKETAIRFMTDKEQELQQTTIPEEFVNSKPSGYSVSHKSLFDIPADAYVNTVNCVGAMGAGIALEFKKRYPKMFEHYRERCLRHAIRPGDCYTYFDDELHLWLLGLAVKDDWRHWSTLEWMESSIKSLKLVILENDIKSVNIPLIGGKNGRRGPYGKVIGFTPHPEREEIKRILETELKPFAEKFKVEITLCLPDEAPKKQEMTLDAFA